MNRIVKFACAGLAALISCGVLQAAEITIDDIVKRMAETDKKVDSVRFNYTQEVVYTLTNEKQAASGEVVFMKPDKLKVSQKSPLEQIITANGKNVWIYTPKYRQVIVDSWKKWLSGSMVPEALMNFSGDWSSLQKKYAFAYLGAEEDRYLLSLTPRQGGGGWRIRLWIDQEQFVPVKARLEGENIAIVTETANYTVNPKVDKSSFNFKVPAGVETLKLP